MPETRRTKAKPKPDSRQNERNLPVRLNKIIADAGVCSRRKADELIAAGVVKVNGYVVDKLGSQALITDFITVQGDPIADKASMVYILLNKPKDYITTTSDELGRKTVMDIVKKRARIYPVGRLDRNTTGVLLMTNDGELANRLTHPSYEIERTYSVKLDKPLLPDDAKHIVSGVQLDDGEKSGHCEVFLNPEDNSKVIIVLREGKNHEVKRIFAALGYDVKQLDRKVFANLTASGLDKGRYRHLTRREVAALKKLVGL